MAYSDVSSDGYADVNGDQENICQPCSKKRKLDTTAEYFCKTCMEYQCKTCCDAHGHFSYMSGHQLIDAVDYVVIPHGTDTTRRIPFLEQEIEGLQSKLNGLITRMTKEKLNTETQYKLTLEKVHTFTEKVQRLCDQLDNSIAELNQDSNLNEVTFRYIYDALEFKKNYLSSAKASENREQMSAAMSLIEKELTTYKKIIDEKKAGLYRFEYNFEGDEWLPDWPEKMLVSKCIRKVPVYAYFSTHLVIDTPDSHPSTSKDYGQP